MSAGPQPNWPVDHIDLDDLHVEQSLPATRLSDHASFWDHGFPAVMITDTAFFRNPYYHTPRDTPDEAAYIKNYGGIPTTITLNISPTIDYLDLENPQATLHLGERTLSLVGPGASLIAGLIVADPGLNTISGSFWNLGDIEIDAGGLLIVNGPQVQNTGVVLVNTGPGSADSAVIRVEGNVALGHAVIPGGELVLNGTETQPAAIEIAPLASLTNLAGHAIRGYGFLQGEVTNEGVIEADPGAKLDLTCNIFINRGTTSVTSLGGSTVHVQDGTVELSEELTAVTTIVDAGGTLTVGDLIFNNGGSMTVDGTLSAGSGVELMNGGELNGSGSVQGDVLNSSGTVAPGSSVGMIDVGSYTQQGGGRLAARRGERRVARVYCGDDGGGMGPGAGYRG